MKKTSSHLLPFSRQLFLSVITLFLAFSFCFMLFQYQREKTYKSELINMQLQNFNSRLYDYIATNGLDTAALKIYVRLHTIPDLRVTLITREGKVIFDNTERDLSKFNNHSSRKEIQDALDKGSGFFIKRKSESMEGQDYFYSAHYYPSMQLFIRSALPYNISLKDQLRADSGYFWFTIIISLILSIIFYQYTQKLGKSITNLRKFALKADRNEEIDMEQTFPNNELGEISQHIIKIYKRLHRAKEALYIEREKLISHLQTSHEGLGVFTKDRKEILVNSLFIQYVNIISDHNLSSTEEVFILPELQSVTEFLTKNEDKFSKEERRFEIYISKNAYTFDVECIIFQDLSFEISVIDVTKEEEQARLKRQLTQNIAHELKTPVSSIRGYLETIISNPDMAEETRKTFLDRSFAQSNRLAFLLRDISILTRLDEASDMMEKEHIDVSLIVSTMLKEVQLALEEKRITVINLLPEELPILGNTSLLYSIFRNLTDNAIAYAGTDINIIINCFRQDENFYYFSFADTGVGVPEEHLTRLFERFYRVDKGRSRKLGGTGLGLAIVKNSVLFHGGTIFAKNKPKGGLEFVFTLAKGSK